MGLAGLEIAGYSIGGDWARTALEREANIASSGCRTK